ncbi:MAG: peptidylprolyl isomerase [Burkholderiaceae bacterium]|nr:MAG: peptidylprolyl isomerase [Betaproteobacteria bacterium TMED100]|tara:strand:+ start:292 stop:789 length:498 start_codon:yes stop_codon:yes gene_type:complete
MKVNFETNLGNITIELDKKKAPKTVNNFVKYIQEGHYDKTIFHRVINGFMIQGGGFEKNMKEKATTAPIENEADNGLKNKAYTLAMARTSDPHSASAQFFINLVDNDFLDHSSKTMSGWGYAVFGKVIKGMEVVDKISEVATATKGFHDDVPVKPITIKKATILK